MKSRILHPNWWERKDALGWVKRGFRGILTVGSPLHPSHLPNIWTPFPLLSRLVHIEADPEEALKSNLTWRPRCQRPTEPRVYPCRGRLVASITVNYTQHTPSKTVTQHVPELPGLFRIILSTSFSMPTLDCWKAYWKWVPVTADCYFHSVLILMGSSRSPHWWTAHTLKTPHITQKFPRLLARFVSVC